MAALPTADYDVPGGNILTKAEAWVIADSLFEINGGRTLTPKVLAETGAGTTAGIILADCNLPKDKAKTRAAIVAHIFDKCPAHERLVDNPDADEAKRLSAIHLGSIVTTVVELAVKSLPGSKKDVQVLREDDEEYRVDVDFSQSDISRLKYMLEQSCNLRLSELDLPKFKASSPADWAKRARLASVSGCLACGR